MLTLTVKDVTSGAMYEMEGAQDPHCIYVVREGDVILYVGRSTDPFRRLEEHFGVALRSSGGSIGPIYKQFKSEAVHWTIDLYTLEECKETSAGRCADVADAERDMIRHFSPCLNERNNPNPSQMPEKYTRMPQDLIDDNAVDYIQF